MSRTTPNPQPPGPPLPRAVQTALMLRYWPWFVAACRRRYGSVFAVRIASLGTVVYLDDPADIKAVFAGSSAIYHAGEANSLLTGAVGESSLLVTDDELHRDRRRLMMAPFHRDAVTRLTAVMAEIAADNISRWPIGTEFPVAARMSEITLEIILRTVIGTSDPDRLAHMREVMPRLLNLGTWASLSIVNPALQRQRPWRYVRRNIDEADALLFAEIADRRADPALAERTDVLAMLVRANDDGRTMTDSELRDQLMTLLVAGHDTTATALSWALERLVRHPDKLDAAVHAADASAAGDAEGDEYLDAIAKETLRIRPVVYDVGRVLTEPVELAGYLLPAGVMVAPGIGLVHSSSQHYSEPGRFDPDRMLGATLGPTTWLPFGGGNRRCLGAGFAMAELRVVLREVLRRVELRPTTARGERPRVKHVILTPHRGARVYVQARRDAGDHGTQSSAIARLPGCPAAGTGNEISRTAACS